MILVKELNELLPQCEVKVMEYRTEKCGPVRVSIKGIDDGKHI
jgi:hypothetical protein